MGMKSYCFKAPTYHTRQTAYLQVCLDLKFATTLIVCSANTINCRARIGSYTGTDINTENHQPST